MSVAKKLQAGPFRPNAKLAPGEVVDQRMPYPTRYVVWEDGSHSWEPDHTPFHAIETPNRDEPLNVLGKPMPGSVEANQEGEFDDYAVDFARTKRKTGLATYGKQRKR